MSLLLIWYEIGVCVELLADDAWAAEDDKTVFLYVGVDIFGRLYSKRRPISFTMM